MRKLDLQGQRFGRLTAISCTDMKQNGNYLWRCSCECGNEVVVKADHLRRGDTQSCGCLNIGRQKGIPKKHGYACNDKRERLYTVWAAMKTRCENPNHVHYRHYGGRGIKVCAEWADYVVFRAWALANGYDPLAAKGQCTIDRIDVDGDYCPENCRWVSMKIQCRNRRAKSAKEHRDA